MSHAEEIKPSHPITFTGFNPSAPLSPTAPKFVDEGKILSGADVAPGATVNSSSVKLLAQNGQGRKTIYVDSDQLGDFLVQVMLDESETSGGNPVWRNITDPLNPLGVVSGYVTAYTFEHVVRQIRILFSADAGNVANATVNAWVLSAR